MLPMDTLERLHQHPISIRQTPPVLHNAVRGLRLEGLQEVFYHVRCGGVVLAVTDLTYQFLCPAVQIDIALFWVLPHYVPKARSAAGRNAEDLIPIFYVPVPENVLQFVHRHRLALVAQVSPMGALCLHLC